MFICVIENRLCIYKEHICIDKYNIIHNSIYQNKYIHIYILYYIATHAKAINILV